MIGGKRDVDLSCDIIARIEGQSHLVRGDEAAESAKNISLPSSAPLLPFSSFFSSTILNCIPSINYFEPTTSFGQQ